MEWTYSSGVTQEKLLLAGDEKLRELCGPSVNVDVLVVFNANVLRLGEDRYQRRSGTSIWT